MTTYVEELLKLKYDPRLWQAQWSIEDFAQMLKQQELEVRRFQQSIQRTSESFREFGRSMEVFAQCTPSRSRTYTSLRAFDNLGLDLSELEPLTDIPMVEEGDELAEEFFHQEDAVKEVEYVHV